MTAIVTLLISFVLVCTNLMTEIQDDEEFNSPNVVKVACDQNGNALYFSREPIPSIRKAGKLVFKRYKRLGIIAFRKDFLHCFATLSPTP
jgi:3-deoxy-manno-octulosonate cytidylyltransferase (CMP-KDO synthetase)